MVKFLAIPLLLSVLGGASWYIARGILGGLECFFSGIRFWHVFAVILSLVGIVVLSFVRGVAPFPESIKGFLSWVGGYGMGVLMYLLLFTLAADLLFMVPRMLKLSFTTHSMFRGYVTTAVLLLTALTCIYGTVNWGWIKHVTYELQVQGKQDISDLKVVLISDLHLGAVGSEGRLERIVEEINGTKPDVICIAGDFFDTDFASIRDPDKALETLEKLQATYGTYACLGNHDGGSTYGQMLRFLEEANVQLLDDAYTVIDDRLILVGRLDPSPIGGYGEERRKDFAQIATWTDRSLPVVVMDHNPSNIHQYGAEVDLILCGHTHKGQVFPGNLITNRMYTVDHGYYRKDPQSPHVIVTSGIGAWGMPIRVGTNSEIVTIRFTCDG